MTREELTALAVEAMGRAYAPYSRFRVGAALLTAEGLVYSGCNIENASYGVTNCAERTALFRAVFEGERDFREIAVVGGTDGVLCDFAAPCGICRQALREFCRDDFLIHLFDGKEYRTLTLAELLPLGFTAADLAKRP